MPRFCRPPRHSSQSLHSASLWKLCFRVMKNQLWKAYNNRRDNPTINLIHPELLLTGQMFTCWAWMHGTCKYNYFLCSVSLRQSFAVFIAHAYVKNIIYGASPSVFVFFPSFAQCYKQKCAAMKGVLFDFRHWISYKWFCWIPVWNSKNTVLPRVEILLKLHLNQRNITSEHHQRSLNKSSSPYFSFLEEDESISFFFYFW